MERSILTIIALFFGFAFGSFLNVVCLRLHNKEKGIITGRSRCPSCKTTLKSIDLIPVISFLLLKGRCRYCKIKIDLEYFIVELINGFIFAFVTYYLLPSLNPVFIWPFLFYLFTIEILFLIALYDYRYTEIPNSFSFPFIFFLIVAISFKFTPTWKDSLIGSAVIFGFFYLQILIPYLLFSIKKKKIKHLILVLILPTWFLIQIFAVQNWFKEDDVEIKSPKGLKEWIGFGDLRIAVIMGLLLGLKFGLIALFLSYLIGAIFGIFIILRKKGEHIIPFGPFLAFGTFITLFYGHQFLKFYLEFGEIIRNFML